MQNESVGIEKLITHRFRGFAKHENTLAGLRAALDFGVRNLEFDLRIAACGIPVIYHDEYAKDKTGKRRYLCDHIYRDYGKLGGTFALMPTYEDLLANVCAHRNTGARLLVDIKDLGFEQEIYALTRAYGLYQRTIFVSWIPEVLYRLHGIDAGGAKILSHWCKKPGPLVRAGHKIYSAETGHIPRRHDRHVLGERSGYWVKGPLEGDMLELLKSSKGGICVPQDMLTRALSDSYHGKGLSVSSFSYTEWTKIYFHKNTLGVDLFFIDNKAVFQTL